MDRSFQTRIGTRGASKGNLGPILDGMFSRGDLPEAVMLTDHDGEQAAGTVFVWTGTAYEAGDVVLLANGVLTRLQSGLMRPCSPPAPVLMQEALAL